MEHPVDVVPVVDRQTEDDVSPERQAAESFSMFVTLAMPTAGRQDSWRLRMQPPPRSMRWNARKQPQ
jgi:hypothetical protein